MLLACNEERNVAKRFRVQIFTDKAGLYLSVVCLFTKDKCGSSQNTHRTIGNKQTNKQVGNEIRMNETYV